MRPPMLIVFSCVLLAQNSGTPPARQASAAHYSGFDRNDYPGDGVLGALRHTFAFTGFWLNSPPGTSGPSSWTGKRPALQDAGFGFAILFNGRPYRELKKRDAAQVGRADGLAATAAARREGFPARAVIFLDQEEGGRLLQEQKAYLYGWADAVNSHGYRAGVYCSGIEFMEESGEHVVTARDIREHSEGRDITYWVSNDACPPSPGCSFAKEPAPARSGVPFAELWQFAQSPRRPDQTARCARTYAGDGNCYPPGLQIHIDASVSADSDPSHGRNR
ncbi:MAG: DUF1906 domain-containing protein [Acidobacteria bacterium]|nr:DUF1906 domain-containing protein [Acidobacteriota bacterium]